MNGYDVRARVRAFVQQSVAPGQCDPGTIILNRDECAELLDGPTRTTFDSIPSNYLDHLTSIPFPSAPESVHERIARIPFPDPFAPRRGPPIIYPDATKTPGVVNPFVTQENIATTIGTPGWTATIRPDSSVTGIIKRHIMERDGLPGPASLYELDHLISLELGGHPSDIRNLWCQPYAPAGMGAHEKDHVENFLKTQVVSGALTLADAQGQIVDDWYAIYLSLKKMGLLPAMVQYDPSGDVDADDES